MSGLKIYELSEMYRQAFAVAETQANQETGEISEDWAEFLDAIGDTKENKVLSGCAFYLELIRASEAKEAAGKRILDSAKVDRNKAESFRRYIEANVPEGQKLKNESVSISWRKSSSVEIIDEKKLPDECFVIERRVSKSLTKDHILNVAPIPEAARIVEKLNLQIS